MGTLYYGDGRYAIPIEDRALSHLKVVIVNKLRRGESFTFSWVKDQAQGGGRGTIWLDPAIPLAFDFSGSRAPQLNRNWLEALALEAGSTRGLVLTDESSVPEDTGVQLP
ncbi:MAG: hypothetical protein JWP19_521 [Rhodoglobus sp.]|nr:hypothetical protein [Rhodoglobus sp.]